MKILLYVVINDLLYLWYLYFREELIITFMHFCLVFYGYFCSQRAMDFCTARLRVGDWVHIFPEGKVNAEQEHLRLKWGVGRLVYDSYRAPEKQDIAGKSNDAILAQRLRSRTGKGAMDEEEGEENDDWSSSEETSLLRDGSSSVSCKTPVVLPMYHIGMDTILPNQYPYRPKTGQRVTILVGEPLDMDKFMASIDHSTVDSVQARRLITDHIQEELSKLRSKAEHLHEQHQSAS